MAFMQKWLGKSPFSPKEYGSMTQAGKNEQNKKVWEQYPHEIKEEMFGLHAQCIFGENHTVMEALNSTYTNSPVLLTILLIRC